MLFIDEVHELICPLKGGKRKKRVKIYLKGVETGKSFTLRAQLSDYVKFNKLYSLKNAFHERKESFWQSVSCSSLFLFLS